MGVRGPRLLELAAETANGLILSGPRKYIEESIKLVLNRRASLNLPRSRFRFVLWVPTVMLLEKSDLTLVKKTVAIVASDTPNSVLEIAGISRNEVETLKANIIKHGIKSAAENVSDRLVDQFCISGDAESICRNFSSYSSLGVDEAVFGPPYGRDPLNAISQVAEKWRRKQ